MQNTKTYMNVAFVGSAVVAWLLVRQVVDLIWGLLRIPMPLDWSIMPPDLIGAGAGIATFFILKRHAKVNLFLDEVISELSKVTWPPRKETVLSTGVILVMVGICSVLLFGFDVVWGTVVKLIYE